MMTEHERARARYALFWRTTLLPAPRPVTEPPTLNFVVTHVIATVLTFAAAMVPVPEATVQTWTGVPGCVVTVTA